MPKISVIIPTRNRCDYLKRAVRSVLCQTFKDFEVIVVNDCSSDDTAEYLSSIEGPEFRHFELPTNSGGSMARNRGTEQSRGSFIAFLDDDDEWEPGKLQEQITAMEQKNADLCHTGIDCYRSDGVFFRRVFMRPAYNDAFKSIMSDNFIGGTSSILVRKPLIDKIGSFDPKLPALQDWDLYIRLIKNGCAVHGINRPLVKYHVVDAAGNVSLNFGRFKKASSYLKRKYRDFPYYPLFAKRTAIIELKRCLKSRRFFAEALRYYLHKRTLTNDSTTS